VSVEIVSKEDLEIFRVRLLDDFKKILSQDIKRQEQPEWLKSGEVRKMLKVSPGTLQNLRISGKIKPVKIEGIWYYNLVEIKGLFAVKEDRL
jgi:hypothetical protein